MPSPLRPKALEQGGDITFISPSARLNDTFPDVMSRATDVISKRGYNVQTLYTPVTGIQANIATRLSEIRTAFMDPKASVIICTIGGNTLTELIPALVADTELHEAIRANPKIVVGYSDITCLHWFLHALTGLRTFYGPGAIPELGASDRPEDEDSPVEFCTRNLFRAIEAKEPIGDIPRSKFFAPRLSKFWTDAASTEPQELEPTGSWTWLRRGKAQGRLFGGCLTVVVRIQGIRAIAPDWRGRIVFLESAPGDEENKGNPIHRVQAAFADLIAQGVFDEVAGLVVGRPFGYNTEKERKDYAAVISGLLCGGRFEQSTFPILFNVDFGHATPMVTLPYDAMAELDSEQDRFAILESGVV